MILLVDNYDSFVHNLARYVRLLGHETRVVRNDRITTELVREIGPTHLLISPGPRSPREAGASCSIIRELGHRLPTLGVCLGHQCIAAAYGAEVERGPRPMHGKTSLVHHDGSGIFSGLPSPLRVGRYHSLVVPAAAVPPALEVVASTADGEVMAVRHRHHPVWGVQFHPESILTEHGDALLRNFLQTEGAEWE